MRSDRIEGSQQSWKIRSDRLKIVHFHCEIPVGQWAGVPSSL